MVGLGMGLQAMAEDFNFYYYVSQWPGSYCAQSSKRCCLPTIGEPDEDFFVFGLYATNSTGAVLRKCPNEQSFEFSELEGLEESLSGLWSSIKCPSNNGQSMWKSLWKNNGVCSNLSLFKYFKQGIIIHCEINLIKALRFQDQLLLNLGFVFLITLID
ncbi:intracellular ribonuclease LX-like isoform X2 [Amborella trichopoda]|uniref:intracellular ribonuclease LX-like isoform X2 n=1 Tax=Amborella trichopoda TaxID=13333 RepID=UPI0009C06DDC|nr:intracellular ribonuclease LX-like isoform X2 [Amborella trichopoda]|eukprot:XP_020523958.1 intracellular ribonuclease LX-like isoform X2 [Amborella trichopoda]